MSNVPFRIHLSEQQVYEELVDTTKPIYLVVSALSHHHQLPSVEGGYGLFAGSERRLLSREVPLSSTPYANGGDLYLAPARAPWWMPVATVAAQSGTAVRIPTRSVPVRAAPTFNLKNVSLAIIGVVALGMLGLLFWPQAPVASAPTPDHVAIAAPALPTTAPTATLLPATPTPDRETQARQNYDKGMQAYTAQNWPVAAKHFRQVFAYNANYSDIRSVLGLPCTIGVSLCVI